MTTRLCPVEDCRTELTGVARRRHGHVNWWCWRCERYWKAGIRVEDEEQDDGTGKDVGEDG